MSSARVVITGLGAITPLGNTASEMWNALCQGKCGIDKITAFDPVGFTCKLAGQVADFKIRDFVPKTHRKAMKMMCRDIELAIVAADEALKKSNIITKAFDPQNINIDPTRIASNIGTSLISCDLEELAPSIAMSITDGNFDIKKWGKDGIELVTPLWLLKYLSNMLGCHLGIIHDIQGPSNTITSAECAAHLAIAEAAQLIARGDSDIELTGGVEAKVNPMIMLRQCLLKRVTTQEDNPQSACRPFDADAKGSVFGEAAGIITIENLETAQKRNTEILAEIVGIGQSNSINPEYEHLEPDGKGLQIAIEKALQDAQITPDDLDLIIPHGTAIPQDDLAETTAIQNALGDAAEKTPVFPTKSMLSNTGAAGGALDIITAVFAMKEGKIPAAKNCNKKADGCKLNITQLPIQTNINYALCCSYTYGGQTSAIVIKKFNT